MGEPVWGSCGAFLGHLWGGASDMGGMKDVLYWYVVSSFLTIKALPWLVKVCAGEEAQPPSSTHRQGDGGGRGRRSRSCSEGDGGPDRHRRRLCSNNNEDDDDRPHRDDCLPLRDADADYEGDEDERPADDGSETSVVAEQDEDDRSEHPFPARLDDVSSNATWGDLGFTPPGHTDEHYTPSTDTEFNPKPGRGLPDDTPHEEGSETPVVAGPGEEGSGEGDAAGTPTPVPRSASALGVTTPPKRPLRQQWSCPMCHLSRECPDWCPLGPYYAGPRVDRVLTESDDETPVVAGPDAPPPPPNWQLADDGYAVVDDGYAVVDQADEVDDLTDEVEPVPSGGGASA